MYPQYTTELFLVDVPFYSQSDVGFMAFLADLFAGLNHILTGCRFAAALVGCSFLLVSLLEYVNIITLYLFLDMLLPHNLRTTLIALYNSFEFRMMPFSIDYSSPVGFQSPRSYSDAIYPYNFSLDWLSNMLTLVVQLMILFSFYLGIYFLRRYLRWDHWLGRLLQIRFGPFLYSNCIMAYMCFHVWFGFSAASALSSRDMSNQYRVMNFAIAVVSMFVTIIVVFAHPAYLAASKEEVHEAKTAECYWEVRRLQKCSELFVCNRLLVPTAMALLIPLTPALACLIVLVPLLLLRIVLLYPIRYRTLRHTFHYFANSILHLLLHLTIIGFYGAVQMQKMSVKAWSGFGFCSVALICLIVLVELLHLFLELLGVAQRIVNQYLLRRVGN